MNKKVVILGGGVGGMSAAHELIERGFDVDVYEYKSLPGGKARSLLVPNSGVDGRVDLPGEHGFRFFPGFYKHLPDTMKRIPYENNTLGVFDNLVHARDEAMVNYQHGLQPFLATFPTEPQDFEMLVKSIKELFAGTIGITPDDAEFIAGKFWQVLTSCEERQMQEYQNITWWEFSEAESRSVEFQNFTKAYTRALLAAQADKANARTIGNMAVQLAFDQIAPDVQDDRLLNGPTNDRWLTPWLTYLREKGVQYHLNSEVVSIQVTDGKISSATISENGTLREVSGDYYVCAFPVDVMCHLLNDELIEAAPELAGIKQLNQCTQWMNGIQFYLLEDIPLVNGHVAYMDTPWALTSVSQRQFWKNVDFTQMGDGQVKGILSIDVSDWTTPGHNGKKAMDCTPEEVKEEVWEQLKRGLNAGGQEILRDEMLHSWFIDPDIHFDNPHPSINIEPLLVNQVGTWELRPEATTSIPNLFLASDYVRTNTDLATMEAANEAARRAVNGILAASSSEAQSCEIFPMYTMLKLVREPFQMHDKSRFEKGLPWDGRLLF